MLEQLRTVHTLYSREDLSLLIKKDLLSVEAYYNMIQWRNGSTSVRLQAVILEKSYNHVVEVGAPLNYL